MKACVLNEINNLAYTDVENPVIKSDELLIRIRACGICSSDIDRVKLSGAYHYPIILGHEITGEVIDVANNVSKEYIGKHVVVFPLLPCNECENCKNGDYAQCNNYNYFGSRCDGGFAEYISVPFWNIKVIDDNIPFEYAALTEPASVAWHAFSLVKDSIYKNLLIIGTGTIGIILGLWAKHWGKNVTFVSRNKKKTEFLKDLGFSIHTDENKKYEVCFECVGTNNSIASALNLIKTKGEIILVGNPKDNINLEKKLYWKILRQEITIRGIWNSVYPTDWDYVTENLTKLPLDKLVTHKFNLSEGEKAFDVLSNQDNFKLKGIFVYGTNE